jgi:maltose alpha-D-glucosyltransferase/alpha-amylase
MEDRFPIVDILRQTPPIAARLPVGALPRKPRRAHARDGDRRGARLHVHAYADDPRCASTSASGAASRRCSSNDRRKIELHERLLFSLPGTPVIYYGDEIGMGDNVYLGDRNGVRTPMQWSADRNAGFSRANPQKLILPIIIDPEYHYESIHVEAQQNNPNSLLWWMKRAIGLRKKYKAFGRGTMDVLSPDNPRVFAFVRNFENESILVVANLSRLMQYAELDLSKWKGFRPSSSRGAPSSPSSATPPTC